ncbi:MAG: DeoR/GlpR family DNA-binding transcription regulator [Spirochaetales bacterium]|nr:DeoR/GlpR family DNA-binding transcription regulator [Spirochaetales bacterium]
MDKIIRLGRIKDYLKLSRSATIQEMANLLEVSHMTIRRDVAELAENGLLKIIHGGVIYQEDTHKDHYQMAHARSHMIEAKQKIARKAVSLLKADDIVIIDAGSTGELIASHLPDEIPITVICYALNIAAIISKKPNCSLIVCGGYYHESSMVLESKEGLEFLKQNRANKAFITSSGVSTSLGITCSNFFERATKHAALEASQESILVADSSKFGLIKTGHFADLEDFDVIITDSGIEQKLVSSLKNIPKVELIIV